MNKNLINYSEVVQSSGIAEFFGDNIFSLMDSEKKDLIGNSAGVAKTKFKPVKVLVEGEHFFNIYCEELYQTSIVKILQKSIIRISSSLQTESWMFQNQVITDDLITILSDAENITTPLNDILAKIIKSLQSHALCENILFFTCDFGHTLKLRESIYSLENMSEYFLAAQTVATLKEIVLSNDVKSDEELGKIFKKTELETILIFPIIHEGVLLGVFELVNSLQGEFGDNEIDLVRRFSRFTGHILKEKYQNDLVLRKESVTNTLGKYLSRNVFDKIKESGQENIGGERKDVLVLFCIIQNFKKLYASLPPTILHKVLNFYYNQMHQIIENHHGTLDKIITPALMSVWNHPVPQEDFKELAISCAQDMIKVSKKVISPLLNKNNLEFSIGIGLNFGPAVAGNIGSNDFLDYTVIGDTINTGQRIEANAGPNEILVSESLYRDVYHVIQPGDKIKEIKAKGKKKPVKTVRLKKI